MKKRIMPLVLAAVTALSVTAPVLARPSGTERGVLQLEDRDRILCAGDTEERIIVSESLEGSAGANQNTAGKPADEEEISGTNQPNIIGAEEGSLKGEISEKEEPDAEIPDTEIPGGEGADKTDSKGEQGTEISEEGQDTELSDGEEGEGVLPDGEEPDMEISGADLPEISDGKITDTEAVDPFLSEDSETEESVAGIHNIQILKDTEKHVAVIFSSDLEKLKAGTLEYPEASQHEASFTDEEYLAGLESAKDYLPSDTAALLTEENFGILTGQEHQYRAGDNVSFYVFPAEGYEVKDVLAFGESGETQVTEADSYFYELFMPDSDTVLQITVKEKESPGEESEDLALQAEAATAAGRSSITVQKVNADTKMNQDYGFTYAFREGVTTLKSISRYNGTLNAKLHGWFGDANGFTTAYCNTFYGALINDSEYSSPISVLYSNVGEYQGQIVDLKVTAVSWGAVNNDHVGIDGTRIYPCILFYKDRIAFNTISVGTVRFQFEFYRHNTETKISPKGHVTMADLDGGQGFRIYDSWGVEGLYIRNGYDHLKPAEGSSYLELRGAEGTATTNSDPRGWCQVDFNGTFTVNWLAQSSWNTSRGPMNAFFISTSQSVGTYEPNPAPQKRIGNTGSSFENMARHNSEASAYGITAGKNFDYVISQRLLPGNYSKFEVTDILDSCLTYKSAKVQTAGGQDVTKYFTVSQSGNTIKFSAQAAFLKTDEAMNDVTYYFRINVTAKDNKTIAAHNHYKSSEYYIKNSAKRQIVSSVQNDSQSTNDTYAKGSITGSCSVRKVDSEDDTRILEGAKFELYQWSAAQNKYVFLKNMMYSDGKKAYESGILTYTADNRGKFRIVEAEAPPGYEGGWQKDIEVAAMGNNTVYEAANSLIIPPAGEITVTKCIREEDIVWAHGNPVFRFRVSGTDMKGREHVYENYVEFQQAGYTVKDGYAVMSCVFEKIPAGQYIVEELAALRYEVESISADTDNVSVSGETGAVSLDRENSRAGLTFTNVKTRYDRYSHTDVVRNTVPVIS